MFQASIPNGVFRTDKIILTNKRKVTDEMAMYFYKGSKLSEKSYYKALAGIMLREYKNTCLELIRDRFNKGNIDLVLKEIKNDLFICLNVDKAPYTKILSNDKTINLTRESGKPYYARKYFNTDDVFLEYNKEEKINKKLGMYRWYKSLNKFISNVDKIKVSNE